MGGCMSKAGSPAAESKNSFRQTVAGLQADFSELYNLEPDEGKRSEFIIRLNSIIGKYNALPMVHMFELAGMFDSIRKFFDHYPTKTKNKAYAIINKVHCDLIVNLALLKKASPSAPPAAHVQAPVVVAPKLRSRMRRWEALNADTENMRYSGTVKLNLDRGLFKQNRGEAVPPALNVQEVEKKEGKKTIAKSTPERFTFSSKHIEKYKPDSVWLTKNLQKLMEKPSEEAMSRHPIEPSLPRIK